MVYIQKKIIIIQEKSWTSTSCRRNHKNFWNLSKKVIVIGNRDLIANPFFQGCFRSDLDWILDHFLAKGSGFDYQSQKKWSVNTMLLGPKIFAVHHDITEWSEIPGKMIIFSKLRIKVFHNSSSNFFRTNLSQVWAISLKEPSIEKGRMGENRYLV